MYEQARSEGGASVEVSQFLDGIARWMYATNAGGQYRGLQLHAT